MNDKYRIDSHKLQYHPRRVAQWMEHKDDWEMVKDIYPIYVEVSPVGACNHRCTFCAVDYIGYKSTRINSDLWGDVAREFGLLGIKSVMFAGEGEPLLHTKINTMVSATLANDVDVSFTTNGVLLDRLDLHGVSWVKVSLNAGTRETYAKVHRTKEKDWDTVWKNIKDAVQRKGDCTIGVQMVLLPENENEASTLQLLCDDAGVDYLALKSYSQHKFSITCEYEGWRPDVVQLLDGAALVRESTIETKEIPYDKCQATPYIWCYVMSTGDVYSCSAYLLDERFKLGNINSQTFREIWHGERRRANWEFVRKDLDIKECRVNCRMNQSNIYLNDLVNGVPHANFI